MAVSMVGAGCGDDNDSSGGAASNNATDESKPPYVYKLENGETFKLAPRIAEKVKSGDTLNVALSMEGQTIPVYGPQYKYGFDAGIKAASDEYGVQLKGVFLGPVAADPTEQIAQVRSQITTNGFDCIAVEGGSNPAWVPVINQMVDQGIPVFTVGTDIDKSKRFGTFKTDNFNEGELDAQAVADAFEKEGTPLKEAMMTTGDIASVFAQERMKGFSSKLKELVPGIKFHNNPDNALQTGFDPAKVYSGIRAFAQGHPGLQVIYQTDAGAEFADKVVRDLGRVGKLFVAGHNVSLPVLKAIEDGVQISTIDQNYPAQSAFPANACAAFLTKGEVLPNTNEPRVVDASNVVQARKDFIETGGTFTPKADEAK